MYPVAASRAPRPPRGVRPQVRQTPPKAGTCCGRSARPGPARQGGGGPICLLTLLRAWRRRGSGSGGSRRRQLPCRGRAARRGCSARRLSSGSPGGGERRGRPAWSPALPDWRAARTPRDSHAPGPSLAGWRAGSRGPALRRPRRGGGRRGEGDAAGDELIAGEYAADGPGRPRGGAFVRVAALPLDLRSCMYRRAPAIVSTPARVVRP